MGLIGTQGVCMSQESVDDAKKIYKQNFLKENKIDVAEMVSWHEACKGDRGERSWWLTTGLLEIFRVIAQKEDHEYYASAIDKWLPRTDSIIGSGPVTLTKANGVATIVNSDRVYVMACSRPERRRLVWHGPVKTPQQTLSEWPSELWQYRNKVDFGYVGGPENVVAWFPKKMASIGTQLMSQYRFYPTTDLRYVSEKDRDLIQDLVWENLHNNLDE